MSWIGCVVGALASLPSPGGGSVVRTTVAETFFILRHPISGEVEWLGTLIIWLLLALSAASLGLIGAAAWWHRREEIVPDDLRGTMESLLADRRYEEMHARSARERSLFASVLAASLREREHGYDAMIRAAEQSSEEQAVRRLRRIEPLNIVGNVAPMIGLFGTVYGMILAFREIVVAGGSPDPVELAAGIGTALTTTFWGLVVAIPALAGYALLRTRLDGLTAEAARSAEELVGRLRDQTLGAEGAPGASKGVA